MIAWVVMTWLLGSEPAVAAIPAPTERRDARVELTAIAHGRPELIESLTVGLERIGFDARVVIRTPQTLTRPMMDADRSRVYMVIPDRGTILVVVTDEQRRAARVREVARGEVSVELLGEEVVFFVASALRGANPPDVEWMVARRLIERAAHPDPLARPGAPAWFEPSSFVSIGLGGGASLGPFVALALESGAEFSGRKSGRFRATIGGLVRGLVSPRPSYDRFLNTLLRSRLGAIAGPLFPHAILGIGAAFVHDREWYGSRGVDAVLEAGFGLQGRVAPRLALGFDVVAASDPRFRRPWLSSSLTLTWRLDAFRRRRP